MVLADNLSPPPQESSSNAAAPANAESSTRRTDGSPRSGFGWEFDPNAEGPQTPKICRQAVDPPLDVLDILVVQIGRTEYIVGYQVVADPSGSCKI